MYPTVYLLLRDLDRKQELWVICIKIRHNLHNSEDFVVYIWFILISYSQTQKVICIEFLLFETNFHVATMCFVDTMDASGKFDSYFHEHL